jgi:DNA-binding transcriptional LysR family regulator
MACRLPVNQPDLTVGPALASDNRILAVAIDHPLVDRDSISVEDLVDCQVHHAGGRLPREYIDTLVPPRTPRGRRVRRRHIGTPSPTQLLAMVARGARSSTPRSAGSQITSDTQTSRSYRSATCHQ